jgi:hypothetical protein
MTFKSEIFYHGFADFAASNDNNFHNLSPFFAKARKIFIKVNYITTKNKNQ